MIRTLRPESKTPLPVCWGRIKELSQGIQLLLVVKGHLEQDGGHPDTTLPPISDWKPQSAKQAGSLY